MIFDLFSQRTRSLVQFMFSNAYDKKGVNYENVHWNFRGMNSFILTTGYDYSRYMRSELQPKDYEIITMMAKNLDYFDYPMELNFEIPEYEDDYSGWFSEHNGSNPQGDQAKSNSMYYQNYQYGSGLSSSWSDYYSYNYKDSGVAGSRDGGGSFSRKSGNNNQARNGDQMQGNYYQYYQYGNGNKSSSNSDGRSDYYSYLYNYYKDSWETGRGGAGGGSFSRNSRSNNEQKGNSFRRRSRYGGGIDPSYDDRQSEVFRRSLKNSGIGSDGNDRSVSSNSKSSSGHFSTFSGKDLASLTLVKGVLWNARTLIRCDLKGSECNLEKVIWLIQMYFCD